MSADIPLDHFVGVARRTRELLVRNDVSISPHSALQRSLADLASFAEVMEGRVPPEGEERRAFLSRTFPAFALGSMLLRAEATPSWSAIREKLRLLGKGAMTTASAERDVPGRGEAFNVIGACGLATFASDVRYSAVDVLCDFRGMTWGVECKLVAPQARPQSIADDMTKGRRQIEKAEARNELERGIVLINVTDVLDHAQVYGMNEAEAPRLDEGLMRIVYGLAGDHFRRRPIPPNCPVRGFAFVNWRVRPTGATSANIEGSVQFVRRSDADESDHAMAESLQRCFDLSASST